MGIKSIPTAQIYSRTLDGKVIKDMGILINKLSGEELKTKKVNYILKASLDYDGHSI